MVSVSAARYRSALTSCRSERPFRRARSFRRAMVFRSRPRTRIEPTSFSSTRVPEDPGIMLVDEKMVVIWLSLGAHLRGASERADAQNASECLRIRPNGLITFPIRAVTRARSASCLTRANPRIYRHAREIGDGSISESAAQVEVASRLLDPRLSPPSATGVQDSLPVQARDPHRRHRHREPVSSGAISSPSRGMMVILGDVAINGRASGSSWSLRAYPA